MDKKNIMALSIIAIAVLLVAVISGSFAYFSAVGTNNANTTVTGSLPTIGTVATSGGVTLNMNLSVANLQSSAQGTYYAQTGSTAPTTTVTNHNVATMAVSGGTTGLTYNCSGTVTISLPTDASANTIKDVITAGSLFVKLTQGTGVKLTDSGTEIDLSGAKTTDITKSFTYTLKRGTTDSANITGAVYFKNTNANQIALNGKTIKVTIKAVTNSCTVAA